MSQKKTHVRIGAQIASTAVGLSALFLVAAGLPQTSEAENTVRRYTDQTPYSNPNNRKLLDSFVTTFEKGHDYRNWYVSNFIVEDDFFQNGWSTDNVVFLDNGDVALAITHERMGKKPYSGGEYQKKGWSQYGRYETIMTAAPGVGAVTGFFTHTNSYFKDPHDEIDIEWIGKEPKMVQYNIYRKGKNIGGEKVRLPFDTTKEFHLYAFEWTPTEIRWYIDNDLIFTVTDEEFDIPDAPQRLMAQVWTGNIYEWHGPPKFQDGASAVIRCVSYTRLNDTASRTCADYPELLRNPVK